MRGWARKFYLAAVLVGAGLLVVGPAVTASAQGYVPPPAPPPPTPGAPTGVISTCTIGTGGATCTATVNGCAITVMFPAGDFTTPTQALFTSGTSAGFTGGTVICTFGISIMQNGAKFTGTFPTPASLTVANAAIAVGDTLFEGTAAGFTPVATASAAGSITGSFDSDPNFLVSSTAAAPAAAQVPAATLPLTGKPFLGEGLLAIGLMGAGGLGLWRWRRATRSNI